MGNILGSKQYQSPDEKHLPTLDVIPHQCGWTHSQRMDTHDESMVEPPSTSSDDHESLLASTSTRGNFPIETRNLIVLVCASTRGNTNTRVSPRVLRVLVLAQTSTRFSERVLVLKGGGDAGESLVYRKTRRRRFCGVR